MFLIPTARVGVATICTKAVIPRNAAVPELGQGRNRGANPAAAPQWSVCAAQGKDVPDIDQNSSEAPVHNKMAWDTQVGCGDWVRAVWVISAACAVHRAGQCIPHWDLTFSKDRKNGFRIGIIAHIFPITGI